MALLELRDLRTFFRSKRGTVKAVNGVSYSVDAGKVLGVVGESGSGKSVSAMSILRLLDNDAQLAAMKQSMKTLSEQYRHVPPLTSYAVKQEEKTASME